VLAVVVAAACDKLGGKEPQRSESGGEIDKSFKPARIKSVKGVSIADVRAAVAKRLKEPRPKPISGRNGGTPSSSTPSTVATRSGSTVTGSASVARRRS